MKILHKVEEQKEIKNNEISHYPTRNDLDLMNKVTRFLYKKKNEKRFNRNQRNILFRFRIALNKLKIFVYLSVYSIVDWKGLFVGRKRREFIDDSPMDDDQVPIIGRTDRDPSQDFTKPLGLRVNDFIVEKLWYRNKRWEIVSRLNMYQVELRQVKGEVIEFFEDCRKNKRIGSATIYWKDSQGVPKRRDFYTNNINEVIEMYTI